MPVEPAPLGEEPDQFRDAEPDKVLRFPDTISVTARTRQRDRTRSPCVTVDARTRTRRRYVL